MKQAADLLRLAGSGIFFHESPSIATIIIQLDLFNLSLSPFVLMHLLERPFAAFQQ
jgi:hypothetical protein